MTELRYELTKYTDVEHNSQYCSISHNNPYIISSNIDVVQTSESLLLTYGGCVKCSMLGIVLSLFVYFVSQYLIPTFARFL